VYTKPREETNRAEQLRTGSTSVAHEPPGIPGSADASDSGRRHGLDSSTDAFVGRLLFVAPVFGSGWDVIAMDAAHARATFVVPPPFHVRLERIWTEQGERRGGVARIMENGHPYDDYYVVFSIRHEGMWNFSSRMGMHTITIGPEAPTHGALGRPVLDRGAPRLSGCAEIRAAM
jgi:hypothetical protein